MLTHFICYARVECYAFKYLLPSFQLFAKIHTSVLPVSVTHVCRETTVMSRSHRVTVTPHVVLARLVTLLTDTQSVTVLTHVMLALTAEQERTHASVVTHVEQDRHVWR